jgi:hypothetical protein
MLENLKEVLSVRAVEKLLEAVVMEFMEYLCCFDRGLSNMSSLSSVLLSQALLRVVVVGSGHDSLLPHIVCSYARCAWFCIVYINGCVFFFLMRLLCVDILLEGYVF